ncbi:MAG TPA: hypothetical protein VFM82_12235 [Flavobacteriaceae bacterium]|nr:hypothetical protein [Flavobacteriaceae bacterium]
MITRVGKHIVELYDSVETLNIIRYQKFNKYLMLGNEVGSTVPDLDKRLLKAMQLVSQGMNEAGNKELENARQTVFNIQNEFSPRQKALAILVKKIDKVQYKGIDSGEIDRVEKHLGVIGMTKEMMDRVLNDVKKK